MFKWLDVDIGNKTIEELNKEMCIENWPKRNLRFFLYGYAFSSSQNYQIQIECLQQNQKPLKGTKYNWNFMTKKIPTECYTQTLNCQEKYLEALK